MTFNEAIGKIMNEAESGAEVKCRCPFCGDGRRKLTASMNRDKGLFHCNRCGEGLTL